MVPDVDKQEAVDLFRQQRVVRRCENCRHVQQSGVADALVEVAGHVWIHVDSVHVAVRPNVMCQSEREVSRPSTDVGYALSLFNG